MSAKRKTTVGVVFGGYSVEHDVSIVTGNQIMRAFNPEYYTVVPIYVTRDGRWLTGDPLMDLKNYRDEIISHKGVQPVVLSPCTQHHGLIINPVVGRFRKSSIKRLDVVFPAIHGTHGEDGTLQGLIEIADIPYVGCAVLGSAIANDKSITKHLMRQNNIPVVDDITFTRSQWLEDRQTIIERITENLTYPLFVKPATLGSSIGVSRVNDESMLSISVDIAASFDRRIMVEAGIIDGIEINCAVMGYGDNMETSVLEQPISWDEFLTYEEKYLRGSGGMKSAERIIPAPISDELTQQIRQYTIDAFKAIDGRGTARIDYLINTDEQKVYLNEINTMPGSLSFYLWQEVGMSQSDVVDKLVKLAQDAFAEKRRNTYNYQTSLVELTASRGLKGVKGTKAPDSPV